MDGTSGLADIEHRAEVLTSLRDYLPAVAGEWGDVVIDTPTAMGDRDAGWDLGRRCGSRATRIVAPTG